MDHVALLHKTGNSTFGQAAIAVVTLLMLVCCVVQPVTVFSGLKPEYPEALTVCTEVISQQPPLRWQAFVAKDRGVSGITYEVKIWLADHDAPGKLIYSRTGLPEPSHTVQEPLDRATKYFGSVRARFLLDGAPRVTDWGQQLWMRLPDRNIDHEYYQYYCFLIPKEER